MRKMLMVGTAMFGLGLAMPAMAQNATVYPTNPASTGSNATNGSAMMGHGDVGTQGTNATQQRSTMPGSGAGHGTVVGQGSSGHHDID
jgi:hypothetical protein